MALNVSPLTLGCGVSELSKKNQKFDTTKVCNDNKNLVSSKQKEEGWVKTWLSDKDKVSTDGNDDGKISFSDKAKSFGKGLLCMVKAAVQHPVATAAVVAGGVALTVATGGAILPAMITAGVAIGTVQVGAGAYKAAKAKTDGEAKAAWEDMGAGTFSIGASVLGAKGALKGTNPAATEMNPVAATVECVKQTPASISKSASAIKTTAVNCFNKVVKTSSSSSVKTVVDEKVPQRQTYYEDDGIAGYDGSDTTAALREEMRNRILSQANLNDENLVVKPMDTAPVTPTSQLAADSKYSSLGTPKLNAKTGKYGYVCENLKDMPDSNGLRGKTPLAGKSERGISYRLRKVQEAGVKRIIDLRAEGECSARASKILQETGMEYVNFPVEDGMWNAKSLNAITDYINAINKGDFYVGCANGQARTDLAVAINYILNPKSKIVPQLYYGSASSSRVSIKGNLMQILKLVENNKDLPLKWGWNSYEEFVAATNKRMVNLISSLK